jgi:hypothetical protein
MADPAPFHAHAPIGGNMDAPGGAAPARPPGEPRPIPENDLSTAGRAIRQLNAWKRDAAFQKLLLAGDANAVAALKQAAREARDPVDTFIGHGVSGLREDQAPTELDKTVDAIANRTILTPEQIDEVRGIADGTRRLRPADIKLAHQQYSALRQNPEWVRRSMITGTSEHNARMRLVMVRSALPAIEEAK